MTLPNPVTTMRVESASDESAWLPVVRELHVSAFSDGILARLGDRFIDGYYRAMVRDSESRLWVACQDGRLVGFLGGTRNRRRFLGQHRGQATRLRILLGAVRLRISPVSLWRAVRKERPGGSIEDGCELLGVAVAPSMRRAGVGAALLREWQSFLQAHGERSYVVYTDNEEGRHFYEKHGGECLFQFRLCGVCSAAFRMPVGSASR